MIKFTSQIPLRTIRSLHKYMPEQTESGKAKEPSPFTTWLPTSVVLCPRIVRAVSAAYVTICSKARLKSHYSLIIRSSLTSPGEKFLAMLIFRVAELEGNDGHRGRPRPEKPRPPTGLAVSWHGSGSRTVHARKYRHAAGAFPSRPAPQEQLHPIRLLNLVE